MRCAIYVRVSTDEQANEGFSIEAQKRRLLSYADSQDWQVVDLYIDEGFSAKDMNRPELQRMIADLSTFDVTLVYKLDRMTRSTSDCDYLLKLLDKNNVKFQSATESFETRTATGRLFIRLVADIAQWERENIAERVRFGMEQMVVEGKRPGGIIPYGYTKEETIIEEEAELIREVRKLYISGMGYRAVALELNRNEKLRRGKEWSQSTVAYTLENPYYAGVIRFGTKDQNGKYVNTKKDERVRCLYGEGKHSVIFTKDEYKEHSELIKRKSNNGYSQIKTYWFSGVLRCGRCGSAMFGRLTLGKNKSGTRRNQYYICSKKHDGRTCDMPTFRQVHIERLVMERLQQISIDQKKITTGIENHVSSQEKIKSESELLKKELQIIKGRRKKWQFMFAQDLMTSEELRENIKEEAAEEARITKQLSNIASIDDVMDEKLIVGIMGIWEEADDEEKKAIVYEAFNQIVVNTDLTKVKGVKNKFFDARIDSMTFN